MTMAYQRTPPPTLPQAPAPPWLYLGLDLGQVSDHSALAIAERNRRPAYGDEGSSIVARYRVGHLQRFPLRTPYPTIVTRVAAMVRDLAGRTPTPHLRLVVDATGVGRPVVDLLVNERLPCDLIEVTITGGNEVSRDGHAYGVPKRNLVSTVQILLQAERLKVADALPDAALLTKELLAFEVKISVSAHDSYGSWREGSHDDLVLAAALACWYGEDERLPLPEEEGWALERFGAIYAAAQPAARLPATASW